MSIRYKITAGLLVIILTSYLALALITSAYVNKIFVKEVQTRVRLDLNSAHDIYYSYVEHMEQILDAVSIRRPIEHPLEEELKGDLGKVFSNIYQRSELDFLTLVDSDGNVIYRAHNPEQKGDNLSEIPLIRKAMQEWAPVSGTAILEDTILEKEGKDLQERARIEVHSTPKSMPGIKTVENRGMVIATAVPIQSFKENIKLGIIFGGYLINNNNEIVDQIKTRVFQDQKYKGKDIGTATIFFDDVRIATNVRQNDGTRAIGSRLSAEVYDYVILKGKIWADRAFVVNDWYITAYEPIRDTDDNIIGSLYVGLLEGPFKHPQKVIIIYFIIALSITAVTSLILMFFYTRLMVRPIESIIRMSKELTAGNLSARCNISPSGEMGQLCRTIDQMAEAVEQHEKKIKRDTQMQILQSEKLASVGRLAAGIAHEINNPLTGILTFPHLLRDKKSNSEEDLRDLNVIMQETTRVREIVRNLLDFARQSPTNKEMVNINEIIRQLLKLIRSQKEFRKIRIEENYDDELPELFADKNQLQQVFLNLLLNAGEAIAEEGTITIATSVDEDYLLVTITDTGCGIKSGDIGKIFDPFFTTKPVGKGTGLGLSVSYGIVRQHGGTIKCESREGEGTTFRVYLALNSPDEEAEPGGV
jgi:two-component system NtrC family sensor kinase